MIPIQRMKITSNISCGKLPKSLDTEDSASTCASKYSAKLGGDILFIFIHSDFGPFLPI